MKSTYLIQRLLPPLKVNLESKFKDNPFSFGGGLRNGGLSNKAMDLFRPIFRFDYMGSAEFEFGAVPEAFGHLYTNLDLYEISSMIIDNSTVWILGKKEDMEEIKSRIIKLTKREIHTKEFVGLKESIDPKDNYWKERFVGWVELDNVFLFSLKKDFIDKIFNLIN